MTVETDLRSMGEGHGSWLAEIVHKPPPLKYRLHLNPYGP